MWYIYRENRDYPEVIDEYIDCIDDINEAINFIKTLNTFRLNPAHLYFKINYIIKSAYYEIEVS